MYFLARPAALLATSLLIGGAWLTASLPDAAAEESLRPRFRRAVETPPSDQEELVAIPLTAEVYDAARADLADLRVRDAQQRDLPFALRTQMETRVEPQKRHWTGKTRSARPLDNGALEVVIELRDDDPAPAGVRLITPLRDFEHRVQVFAVEGEGERPLQADGLIFDYTRFIDFRNVDVPLPATSAKQLRIVIDDVTQEQESRLLEITRQLRQGEEAERTERTVVDRQPFRIDRIELWSESSPQRSVRAAQHEYPPIRFEATEDRTARQTIVRIDMPCVPLDGFTLETSDRNFSRAVKLETSTTPDEASSWRQVGAGVISRLDFRALQQDDRTLPFPLLRERHYRLIIENRDNPPLTITGVRPRGIVEELVFFATPDEPLHLVYGDADARPPQFDTAAIQAALGEGYAPQLASLGDAEPLAAAERPTAPTEIFNNPYLLFGVIGVLVAALAWLLFQASRRIERLPDD